MQQTDRPETPEVAVALYLIGNFCPEEVGAAFGVVPHMVVAKGSQRRRKSTGEVLGIYSDSTWGFSSSQVVRSSEIDEHVTWLIARGATAKGLINESVHAFIEVRVQCNTSCVLPESLLEFARRLSAQIGIVARASNAA